MIRVVCFARNKKIAGRILLYGPLNLKDSFPARPINLRDIINTLLTNFVSSVRTVSYSTVADPRFFPLIYGTRASRLGHKRTGKNSVSNLQYGPRTRLIRGRY